MDPSRNKEIYTLGSFANRHLQLSVKHERGVPPGHLDSYRSLALLDKWARPKEEVGVSAFFRGLPGESFHLINFCWFNLLDEVGDLFP